MPTYQYACTESTCGHRFEAVQAFSDEPLLTCPVCEGRLRKVFSAVGVVFKGSGFYRNDSRAESRKSEAKPAAGGTSSESSSTSGASGSSSESGSGSGSSESGSTGSDRTPAKAATSNGSSSGSGSAGASRSSAASASGS